MDNVVMLPVRRRNRSQFSSVLASLAEFFPLDSYVDCYQQPDRIDQFVSLPKKIHDSLVISPPPSTETEVERLKVKIIGGIEAFLGYMCDYYAQAATPVDTVPDYGIHNLVGRCHKFPFGWAQRPMFQNQIELLQSATDKMASAKSPEEFNIAYDEIRGALLGLKRFAPVVVNISSTTLRTEESIALESFPDWAFELVARRVIFIFVRPDVLPSINPGNYYLRPAWRRGNRLSYPESDKLPLRPVHFMPRWEYWETIAANILPPHLANEIDIIIRNQDLLNRINLGETDSLEFKSILRTCENKILKSIAAFCNTNGGELLIGIKNDCTVCGIGLEGFDDYDKLMLHLGNIISEHLNPCLVDFVKYDMVNLDGKWICHVKCKASNKPVWLDTDKFYVRNGPSSIELQGQKLGEYTLAHYQQGRATTP
ncbi:MAG: ATP-binding protein [Methylococcaceae bacterium]